MNYLCCTGSDLRLLVNQLDSTCKNVLEKKEQTYFIIILVFENIEFENLSAILEFG